MVFISMDVNSPKVEYRFTHDIRFTKIKVTEFIIQTNNINIPTIGIGSSKYCDGQVLVTDDLLGLNNTKIRFVKKFVNIRKIISDGIKKFKSEVSKGKFPSKKYSY